MAYLRKTKSDFSYKRDQIFGHNFVIITDKDTGSISVTNDIENVVKVICIREEISEKSHLFIYKDSEGNWDGWDGKEFILLGEKFAMDAAKKYSEIIKKEAHEKSNSRGGSLV